MSTFGFAGFSRCSGGAFSCDPIAPWPIFTLSWESGRFSGSSRFLGLRSRAEVRIPAPEGVLPLLVEHAGSYLQEEMCSTLAPSHLLFLHHSLAHDLIDRRLDETGSDPFPVAIALPVVRFKQTALGFFIVEVLDPLGKAPSRQLLFFFFVSLKSQDALAGNHLEMSLIVPPADIATIFPMVSGPSGAGSSSQLRGQPSTVRAL